MADYTINKGDTLSKIAKQHGIDWRTLYDSNQSVIGSNPNMIKVGTVIKIPGVNAPDPSTVTPGTTTPAPTTPTPPPLNTAEVQKDINSYGTGNAPVPDTFNWNADEDAQYQQFVSGQTDQIMQSMADRNLLNSSVTQSDITRMMASASPEYMQRAYERWDNERRFAYQQEQDDLAQQQTSQEELRAYLAALDDDSYKQYKTSLASEQASRTQRIANAETYVTQQKAAVEDAIKRTNQTGVVDNDAALVLGVPAGTPVAAAAEGMAAARQNVTTLEMRFATMKAELTQQTNDELAAMAYRDAFYNPRVVLQSSAPSGYRSGGTDKDDELRRLAEEAAKKQNSKIGGSGTQVGGTKTVQKTYVNPYTTQQNKIAEEQARYGMFR